MLTLEQGNKMTVMDQGPDLLVEHTLCVLWLQCPVLVLSAGIPAEICSICS